MPQKDNEPQDRSDEEIVEEFFSKEDEFAYSVDTASKGGDMNNQPYVRELLTPKLYTLISQIRQSEAQKREEAEQRRYVDGMITATQWLIDNGHIKAGKELNEMLLDSLTNPTSREKLLDDNK